MRYCKLLQISELYRTDVYLVRGVNHSLVAAVPSPRWAPNHRGSVKDGEAAYNTAQGNQ